MPKRAHILVTNDDGIYSEGIYALAKALGRVGDVTVVAPDSEQSAVGHGITMAEPLRVKKISRRSRHFGYAVSGTPADCVKIAVNSILKRKPDMVVSGINLGPNVGFSVLYSGTVSGAMEGAILSIPSIAVSLATFVRPDFRIAASFTAELARYALRAGIPRGTCLNVNVPAVPAGRIKGVRITAQGRSPITESFDRRVDPRGVVYYWLTGESLDLGAEGGSDISAVQKGYVSITPLRYDITDYECMERLKTNGGAERFLSKRR